MAVGCRCFETTVNGYIQEPVFERKRKGEISRENNANSTFGRRSLEPGFHHGVTICWQPTLSVGRTASRTCNLGGALYHVHFQQSVHGCPCYMRLRLVQREISMKYNSLSTLLSTLVFKLPTWQWNFTPSIYTIRMWKAQASFTWVSSRWLHYNFYPKFIFNMDGK